MQPTKQYVAYYRVSTQRQGVSGLGLEAQQAAVAHYNVIAEFTEVESGRKDNRPELAKALAYAEAHGATLLIAKLDRLARSVAFITKLLDGKVPFISADMPDANRMMLQISAVFAEHEARMISDRTKAAIKAKRARGDKWGTNKVRTDKADQFAEALRETIQALNSSGITGLADITRELNARGIRTSTGAIWGVGQVGRLIARLGK